MISTKTPETSGARFDGARLWVVTLIGDPEEAGIDEAFVGAVGVFTTEQQAKAVAFDLTEEHAERVQVQVAITDGGLFAGPDGDPI